MLFWRVEIRVIEIVIIGILTYLNTTCNNSRESLEKLGYKVHALAKISEIVCSLYRSKSISKEQADAVLGYIKK